MKITNKYLLSIVLIGLLLRVCFYFFGAEHYYGFKNFFTYGDSKELFSAGKNLVDNGIFSTDLNNPEGVFKREPGYSLLMALFYILSFKNVEITFFLLAIFQILFDSICIYIVYRISINLFKDYRIAIISALLYALYPFAIFWTSIAYAEIFAINLCLISVYLATKEKNKYHFLSGAVAAYAAFVRPQLFLLLFAYILSSFLLSFIKNNSYRYKSAIYLLGFILIYGCWPIRNYVNHNELIFFKKTENTSRDMSLDRLNFAFFMWSVKTDWEPQISQLLAGEEVKMPEWVWEISSEDSAKLKKALLLSYQCGDGFRQLRKLQPLPKEDDCTTEVALLWKDLKNTVKSKTPLQYYLIVPLGNIKKAIFKNALINSYNRPNKSNLINIVAKILFGYRTLLLILGIVGFAYIILLHKANQEFQIAIYYMLFYCMGLYFWLCFIYRDMDIRYLLPADVLLIIPAAFFISVVLKRFKQIFLTQ